MTVTRADAYVAVHQALRALDDHASPIEVAAAGAEACLLALAHVAGPRAAAQAAYEMADVLATKVC